MASGNNSRGSRKRPRKSYKPIIRKIDKERAKKRLGEEAQLKKMFKSNKKKILGSECVICFTPGNKQILTCGHIICPTCYNHLCLNKGSNCPICRKKDICIKNSYLLNEETTLNSLTQHPLGLYLFGKCEQFLN